MAPLLIPCVAVYPHPIDQYNLTVMLNRASATFALVPSFSARKMAPISGCTSFLLWLTVLQLSRCLRIVNDDPDNNARKSATRCWFEEGRMLAAINDHREFHSSPPLKWSDDLASSARTLAAELSRRVNCKLPLYYREEIGTNYLSADLDRFSESLAVQFWYEGHIDYDFEKGGPLNRNPNVLSFTQLVWSSTREVGCAVACCDSRQLVLVCRFHPPGNIQGHYMSNVKEKFERLKDLAARTPTEL
ncbi:putative pathogenesis-related protein [Babesia sp. Xinjiang]|uniref:putative pathogenesis-related protein n=1 Tax=Babesia sp. Xinjiang TaxID=462227 RepID=UPI000A25B217|nr:putative pathogenesis-related protein [Babesia sp. Xinjiang]ORM42353.1 putative pathogenesis-related protein [Babesia sp. Xinjiang]